MKATSGIHEVAGDRYTKASPESGGITVTATSLVMKCTRVKVIEADDSLVVLEYERERDQVCLDEDAYSLRGDRHDSRPRE